MDRSKDQDKSRTERIAEFFALFEHAPENTPRTPPPAPSPFPEDPQNLPSNAELMNALRPEESPLKRAAVLHGHLLEEKSESLTAVPQSRRDAAKRREERRERKNSFSGVFQRLFGDSGLRRRAKGVSVSEQLQLSEVQGWHLSDSHGILTVAKTIFTCGIVALGTFALAKSAPLQHLAVLLGSNHSTALAYSVDQSLPAYAVFKPKFGPHAIQQCMDRCKEMRGPNSCPIDCRRLSLTEYAKPVPSRTLDPQADANEILESCQNRPIQFAGQWSKEQWKDQTGAVRNLLDQKSNGGDAPDFGEGRLMYHELMGIQREVALPVGAGPAELATTERTVRAGCLKAHLILTELGLVIVHQAKDNEAETYYRAVQRILKMESQKAEQLLRADPLKPAQSRPVKLAAKPRK